MTPDTTPDTTQLANLLKLFRYSAFRYEGADHIGSDLEAFENYRAGQPAGENEAWSATITAARTRGARIRRVRLIRAITDYARFEMDRYAYSLERGEEIRILVAEPFEAYGTDFWLFDDIAAVLMFYRPDGTLEHVVYGDLSTEEALIRRLRIVRDTLMQRSIPLADYLTVAYR